MSPALRRVLVTHQQICMKALPHVPLRVIILPRTPDIRDYNRHKVQAEVFRRVYHTYMNHTNNNSKLMEGTNSVMLFWHYD